MMAILVEEFRPVRKNSLRGFATIHMTGVRMRLLEVAIHESNGRRWASPPSRPRLDRSGRQQTDEAGKGLWQPLIVLDSRDARDEWSDRVVAALVERYPNAFAAEAEAAA